MVNYQNGKIYKIEDMNGEMCYIGSTTKDYLSKRMSTHRSNYKQFLIEGYHKISVFEIFDKYGVQNCRIVLLELVPSDSKDELLQREAHFIKTIQCVNKVMPNRGKIESAIEYRRKNREMINAKKSSVITCECGKAYTYGHQSRHRKTQPHLEYIASSTIDI